MKIYFKFTNPDGHTISGHVESADENGFAIACGDDFDQLFVEPMIHTCGLQDGEDAPRSMVQ